MRSDEGFSLLNMQTNDGFYEIVYIDSRCGVWLFTHFMWYECVAPFFSEFRLFSLDTTVSLLARSLFGIYFVHVLLIWLLLTWVPTQLNFGLNTTNINGLQLYCHSSVIKTVFKLDIHDLQSESRTYTHTRQSQKRLH